jgi:hypothetical protein
MGTVDVVRLLCWSVCTGLMIWSRCVLALNEEGRLLLQWKQGLNDPENLLGNWNPADATPCMWTGVQCTQGSISAISLVKFTSLTGPVNAHTFGSFPFLSTC